MGVSSPVGVCGRFFPDLDSTQRSMEDSRREKGSLSEEEVFRYAQCSAQLIIDNYGFWNEKKVFDLSKQSLNLFSDCYRQYVGEEGLKRAKTLYRKELLSLLAGSVMNGRLSFFEWNQALINRVVKDLCYDQPIGDLILKAQNSWRKAFGMIREYTSSSDMGGAAIEEIESISLDEVKKLVEAHHIQDTLPSALIKG